MRKACKEWVAVWTVAATTFMAGGCPLLEGIGANDTQDNTNDNTGNDNSNNNTNGNTNDNTNDNSDSNRAIFDDPDSDFSTADVRDVNDEIIQFDTETMAIVWVADGRSFQAGNWPVTGNMLGSGGAFQVRFGTVGGERRAYFTETVPATICDFVVEGDNFLIFPTTVTVPQE